MDTMDTMYSLDLFRVEDFRDSQTNEIMCGSFGQNALATREIVICSNCKEAQYHPDLYPATSPTLANHGTMDENLLITSNSEQLMLQDLRIPLVHPSVHLPSWDSISASALFRMPSSVHFPPSSSLRKLSPSLSPSRCHFYFHELMSFTATCRISTSMRGALILVLLLLLTSPLGTTGLLNDSNNNNNDGNDNDDDNDDSQGPAPASATTRCNRHFAHRIQGCVEPFTSLLDLYDIRVDRWGENVASTKHICLEYEMVLLCLHSALNDCPTLGNLKQVQSKLSSHWVTLVNNLCAIQSKESNQHGHNDNNRRHSDDFHSQTSPFSSETSSNEIGSSHVGRHAQSVIQRSNQKRAGLMRNVMDTGSRHSTKSRHYTALGRKINVLHGDQVKEEGSKVRTPRDPEVNLRIIHVVQNFNYPQSTGQNSDFIGTAHPLKSAPISNSAPFNHYDGVQMVCFALALCVFNIIHVLKM